MYYIYHIENVKIGCSKNPKNRVKSQGYTTYEILEEHSDINIASIREIELQKQYGYQVDSGNCVYSIKFTDNGKVGGIKRAKNKSFKITSKLGRIANKEKNGHPILCINLMTQEIKEYNSLNECAKEINVNQGNITNLLKGRCKSLKGYTFKYKQI